MNENEDIFIHVFIYTVLLVATLWNLIVNK